MTVKELIAKLQQYDLANQVLFYVEERDCEREIKSMEEQLIDMGYDYKHNKLIRKRCVVLIGHDE